MNTGYTAKYSSETSGSTTIIGTDNITIPDPNLIFQAQHEIQL